MANKLVMMLLTIDPDHPHLCGTPFFQATAAAACAMMLAGPMLRIAGSLESELAGGEVSACRQLLDDLQAEFIRLRLSLEETLAPPAKGEVETRLRD